MTKDRFTDAIDDIREALKKVREKTLADEVVNAVPIRDMIDELTRDMKQQAKEMDQDARKSLASELLVIASDLDALEHLIRQRLSKGSN